MRGPRVRVNGWQPGDPRGAGWRRIAEAQGEAVTAAAASASVATAAARRGGWMCGDLVSNHGTTGRASIERAEARPSYPILSFAWNHVGAGVVLVQTNPTQPTGLALLRLHLRVSTDRPPPPSLCTSSFSYISSFHHRLLLVLVLSSFSISSYYYHVTTTTTTTATTTTTTITITTTTTTTAAATAAAAAVTTTTTTIAVAAAAVTPLPPSVYHPLLPTAVLCFHLLLLVLLPPKPSLVRPTSSKATYTRAYVSPSRVLPYSPRPPVTLSLPPARCRPHFPQQSPT